MVTAIIAVVIGFVAMPLISRFMHLLPLLVILCAAIVISGVGMFLLPFILGILGVYAFCAAVMKKVGGGE